MRLTEIVAAAARDVGETAALVAQQNGALPWIAAAARRMAKGVAGGDEQILPTVAIDIEEARPQPTVLCPRAAMPLERDAY